jgi:hypothetical protein
MQRLATHLRRLYLTDGLALPEGFDRDLGGDAARPVSLLTASGLTRAIAIAFERQPGADADAPWQQLCVAANALQTELGLPAPAVSVSGANGYILWLSLQAATPLAQVRQFTALLGQAYLPDTPIDAREKVALPPCLHAASGRWAAFINPGLGASFSDEYGLDMAPPVAGQVALLEHLQSIGAPQWAHACALLQAARGDTAPAPVPAPAPAATAGALLANATVEQIVAELHARGIEPSLRHVLAR